MDYRLGRVKTSAINANTTAAVNFIDDDNIASYYLTNSTYVNPTGQSPADVNDGNGDFTKSKMDTAGQPMVFEGPRGSTIQLKIQASQELQQSTYLFSQIGSSQAANSSGNIFGFPTTGDLLADSKTIYYIDSTIRVMGANTGYRIDIPVRYVKLA